MASLLGWIGDKAKRLEAQVNPFDHGATYSNPNPQPPQQNQPARPAGPGLSQRVANFLGGIPNVHLNGLTDIRDLWNGSYIDRANARAAGEPVAPVNPVTIGDVGHHIPLLKQGIDFANRQDANNPNGNPVDFIKDFVPSIFKTGAHYAPYAVPEAGIVKAGEGAGIATRLAAKGANNFVPAAGASVLDQVVEGNRNPGDIAKNAAVTGLVNAGLSELPMVRNVLKRPGEGLPVVPEPRPAGVTELPGSAPAAGPAPQMIVPQTPAHVRQAAEDMLAAIHPHNDQFGLHLTDLGQALGEDVSHGPIKGLDRLAEKAHLDYGGDVSQVRDGIRGMVHISDPANLQQHLDEIANRFNVTRVKHVDGSNTFGYKDTKVNVLLPSGHEAEIQIITPEMAAAKKEGHAVYEKARTETDANKLAKFEQKMRSIYAGADEALNRRLASTEEISSPLNNASAGGNEVPAGSTSPLTDLPSETNLTSVPSTSKNLTNGAAIEPPYTATLPQNAVPGNPKIVGNKFTESVKNSPEVSPEVRAQVSGQHVQRNTADLVSHVQQQIKTEGLDNALNRTLEELSVPPGQTSDETLARAIELAKHFDSQGDTASQDLAARLYDQVSEHGVGKGQGSQILSMLARRSPAGLRNKAFRDLKKAGIDVNKPENAHIKKEIQTQIDSIRGMEDGPAKDFAIAVLQKSVTKHIPQGFSDNGISIWKAGLLSGVKTQGGNLLSNSTFGAMHDASNPLSVVADKIMSVGTGERTKALTARGRASGTVEGAKNAKVTMKTGIDMRQMGDKYEQHAEINIGNKVIQRMLGKPSNYVFRALNAADQPFYYSALKNSLYDQAKADGINLGLKGSALRKHMDEMVANPTENMAITANKEAAKSVLGYDTFASKAVTAIHSGIDKLPDSSKAGKAVAHAFVNVLAPFVRVPSAFLSRTIDFTPLGVGKEVFSQVAKKQFDQRALSTAIGEGLTGAGAIALGVALTQSGQLSGDYPKSDAKEQARWKAEGITPNSIKLGGKWISLNYMGPLGLLFNAGHKVADASKNGGGVTDQAASALAGLGQGLMGQSFLQGFSGFSDAVKDPERNAASFVHSEISSLIPSWSNDLANATDTAQRQVSSTTDAIKQRIPGARETLMVKKDAFGNPLDQPNGSGLDAAFNPLKPSKDVHNPLLTELDRLKSTGKDNFVFPTPDKTLSVGNETVKMDPQQQDKYNTAVGQQTQDAWNQIVKAPGYKDLTDTQKANALRTAASDIQAVNKQIMLQEMGRGDLVGKSKLSSQQEAVMAGGITPDMYVAKALGKLTPAQDYQEKLAEYKAKKAAGQLSALEDFNAQQELGKLKITSQYSQDVLDLYGLSKAKREAFLKAHPEQAGLMDQVAALSTNLKNTGFTSTDKIASARKGRKAKALKLPAGFSSTSTKVRNSTVKVSKASIRKAPKAKKVAKAKQSGGPKVPKTRQQLA
jgi:hypothetical protein